MQVIHHISEFRAARAEFGDLALVPTMGALHAGHLSLIELAKFLVRDSKSGATAVSIFVNPTQFGPQEDFLAYPRPVMKDLEACEKAGVDLVFAPGVEEIYPPGSQDVIVDLPALSGVLEGKHRPGHFRGVCQVVAKLFNITRPTSAIFGQKDFQQLRILTAMVESMYWPIKIVPAPTMRDADGLALSSRNQYLSDIERKKALAINRALRAAESEFAAGIKQTNRLVTTMQNVLLEQHLNIDYVAAVDAQTLRPVNTIAGPTVLAIAARAGRTRLIDNLTLEGF
jgi:pantoate--beta-alanine ligase